MLGDAGAREWLASRLDTPPSYRGWSAAQHLVRLGDARAEGWMTEYLRRPKNSAFVSNSVFVLRSSAPARLAAHILLENIASGQRFEEIYEIAALTLHWGKAETIPSDALARIRELYDQRSLVGVPLLGALRTDLSAATIQLLLRRNNRAGNATDRTIVDALHDLASRLMVVGRSFSPAGEIIGPPSREWILGTRDEHTRPDLL